MSDWSLSKAAPMPPEEPTTAITPPELIKKKPGPKPRDRSKDSSLMVILTPELLTKMKHSVDIGTYKSRSEIVRAALNDFYYPKFEYTTSLATSNLVSTEPSSKTVIGKLMFDTTHQPGFIRRKLLKWLLGVTVV